MRPCCAALALGTILLAVGARPAQAGIYNGYWSRSDGVFLTTTFDGSRHPQATISRGFCYDFFLNIDFIDLTTSQSENSGVMTGLTRVKTLNGAQNSVNGHAIGQLQLHFCVSPWCPSPRAPRQPHASYSFSRIPRPPSWPSTADQPRSDAFIASWP